MRGIDQDKVDFDSFHYFINGFGTMCVCWMDSGLVFCVSIVREVGSKIKRNRKHPRMTMNNKNYTREVWSEDGAKEIYIPLIIDDYNHWMGGVDLSDNIMACYHLNLRSRRNWISTFLKIVSILCNNLYVIHREHFGKNIVLHTKSHQK